MKKALVLSYHTTHKFQFGHLYEKNLKNLKNQKRVSALSRYPLDNYLCCFFVELVEKSLVSDAVCPYLKFLREEF